MKKNKAAIIGLCVALVMCFMPGAVRAYTAEGTSGTVQWTIDEEGTMVFSPVSGTAGTLAATPNEAGDSPFIEYRDQIRKIRFEGTIKSPSRIRNLFKGLDRLEEFDARNLMVDNVNNAIDLFNGCSSLRTLDLSGWNVSRLIYLSRMFANCSSLEYICLNGWDMESAKNMSGLFEGCSALREADLSSWNPIRVENISSMFKGCSSLLRADLRWPSTPALSSMSSLFSGCLSLQEAGVDSLNTSSVTSMSSVFENCRALSSLDIHSWDTSRVKNFTKLFFECRSLRNLRQNLSTSAATTLVNMFTRCESLEELDVSGFDVVGVKYFSHMFEYCVNLRTLNTSGWDVSGALDFREMFAYAGNLQNLDVASWNVRNAEIFDQMFMNTFHLNSLDVSLWNTENGKSFSQMFSNCASPYLDLSEFVFSEEAKMTGFFGFPLKQVKLGGQRMKEDAGLYGFWKNEDTGEVSEGMDLLQGAQGTWTRYIPDVPPVSVQTELYPFLTAGKKTEDLSESDKEDPIQRNYRYKEDLSSGKAAKIAEWTDQSAAEGKITLLYSPPAIRTQSVAVYAIGTCSAHSFSRDIAKSQIYELLDHYDRVDLISTYSRRDSFGWGSYAQRRPAVCSVSATDSNLENKIDTFLGQWESAQNGEWITIVNGRGHISGGFNFAYLLNYLEDHDPSAIYAALDGSRAFQDTDYSYELGYLAEVLYGKSKEELDVRDLTGLCVNPEMLEKLAEYQREGKYYVSLSPEYLTVNTSLQSSDLQRGITENLKRQFAYASVAAIAPAYFMDHNEELQEYIFSGQKKSYAEFLPEGQMIYNYGTTFGMQNIRYDDFPVTLEDTVDARFEIVSAECLVRDKNLEPVEKVSHCLMDGQTVRFVVNGITAGEVVEVLLQVRLKNDPQIFKNENGFFDDTNEGEAFAESPGGVIRIGSPKLYRNMREVVLTKKWRNDTAEVRPDHLTVRGTYHCPEEKNVTVNDWEITGEDEWKAVFYVPMNAEEIKVWENVPEYYTANHSSENPLHVADDKAFLENTYVPPVSDITVRKRVAGNLASRSKHFRFTLRLSKENTPYEGSVQTSAGEMEVRDGIVTFELADGEEIVFQDIRHGTQYEITEEDSSNQGYIVTVPESAAGILGEEDVTAEFVNTRQAAVPTGLGFNRPSVGVFMMILAGLWFGCRRFLPDIFGTSVK